MRVVVLASAGGEHSTWGGTVRMVGPHQRGRRPLDRLDGQPMVAGRSTGRRPLNGAQSLVRTLADCGVELCIANPGTSEMHFVAALDAVPSMRAVLGLFEGVVTGAADGYGRMSGKP